LALGSAGATFAFNHFTQSSESPLEQIQKTLDADAANGAFTGPLGDFTVVSRTGSPAQDVIDCPAENRELVSDTSTIKASELWQDAFGLGASGVSCDGRIVVVNSGSDPLPDGTQSIVKMYFRALPAPVAFDAPKDRIELTKIDGHSAILEEPLAGYPYATASLALIERYPSRDQPGIIAYVNFAPSTDIALDLAKQLTQ
jgi:hypothetical protein